MDYTELTTPNNEAIVIAGLHLSIRLLGKDVITDPNENFIKELVELADKIQEFIYKERSEYASKYEDLKRFFSCQRNHFFPLWVVIKEPKVQDSVQKTPKPKKRDRSDCEEEQGKFILIHFHTSNNDINLINIRLDRSVMKSTPLLTTNKSTIALPTSSSSITSSSYSSRVGTGTPLLGNSLTYLLLLNK